MASLARAQPNTPAKWIQLKTEDMEFVSTGGTSEARKLLRTLAEARLFLSQIGYADASPGRPVKVFAFQSSAEYDMVRLNRGTFGHCIRGRRGDFIVLEDIQPQHWRAAIHELTHLVLSRAGLHLPVWLNEGLADVYSTLSVTDHRATFGSILPARSAALKREPWLDLATLFGQDDEQRLFREGKEVAIFYGQSWALTHMLMFSPSYAPGFPEFIRAISGGRTTIEALHATYGTTGIELASDLQRYWHEGLLPPRSMGIAPAIGSEPESSTLSQYQGSLALVELLSASPATQKRGEALLLSLREQGAPDSDNQGQINTRVNESAGAADERAAMTPTSNH